MEYNRYLVNLTYFFLHAGTLKKVKQAKAIVAYASLATCGWKGRNQIVPTGKGQYQLGKQHCSHADKETAPKKVKRITAKGQPPFSLKDIQRVCLVSAF